MAKIAVVILNYNGKDYLEKFLPSVINHSSHADIVVADNASTDTSVTFLKTNFPEIKIIVLDKNHGYAGGYNEALKQIDATYFLLLNSDVEVTTSWLDPLETFLDANPNYAACQPKIKDYNDKTLFEYAGASGGFIDTLGYPFCRGRIFSDIEMDLGQYNEPIDIFWASGACVMVRANVFFKIGGFDGDFFAHMEEIDLCWRIHSLGYQVKCIPASTVYHVGGGTLAKKNPFKTYLNFRNGLYLLLKNLPLKRLVLKFPMRILLDWVAALKFLVEGNASHSFAIIKAHFVVLFNFIKTLKKRKLFSLTPKSKSIIVEYHLKNNRKYSDL